MLEIDFGNTFADHNYECKIVVCEGIYACKYNMTYTPFS